VDIRDEFRPAFAKLQHDGWLTLDGENIDTTRDGLMQIDRHLPVLFDPQFISDRYT
jgi:oxygen-independent coproporphyrinogen III oxidase